MISVSLSFTKGSENRHINFHGDQTWIVEQATIQINAHKADWVISPSVDTQDNATQVTLLKKIADLIGA